MADEVAADSPQISPPAPLSTGSWRHVAQHLQAVLRGEFVIEREIGRGGMAAVYLAYEASLQRYVAIKVMSPALLSGHDAARRFEQEAVTVANLSHANIVTVHAVRDIDDLHFFVMKFVDGRALDRILAAERRLPLAVVRSILFQVGGALSYAHRHGVVHRDIKPANILIDKSGDAVVTDFGIAKVAESSAHTQTGMLIGTPTYMSPEQCLGLPVSAASDQYALGIVAYELLTGAPPFAGPSLMVLQAHISRPPTPVGELAPDCPADVAAAVARMLAKDPAERWPTIGQAVQALGGGPLAEDDPLRETLAAMAGATPAAGTAVGTAAVAPAAPVASPVPTPPDPPPPSALGTMQLSAPDGATGLIAAATVQVPSVRPTILVTGAATESLRADAADGSIEARAPGTASDATSTAATNGVPAELADELADEPVHAAAVTELLSPLPASLAPTLYESAAQQPTEPAPHEETLMLDTRLPEMLPLDHHLGYSAAAGADDVVATYTPQPLVPPVVLPAGVAADPPAPSGRWRRLAPLAAAGVLVALGAWWVRGRGRDAAPTAPLPQSATTPTTSAPPALPAPDTTTAPQTLAPPPVAETPAPTETPAPQTPVPTSPPAASASTTAPRTRTPATRPVPAAGGRTRPPVPDVPTTDAPPPTASAPSRNTAAGGVDQPRQEALIAATIAAVVDQVSIEDRATDRDLHRPSAPVELETAERERISKVVAPFTAWLRETRPELGKSRLDAVAADTLAHAAPGGATADATLSVSWRPNRFRTRKHQDLVLRVVLARDTSARWRLKDVWLVEHVPGRP